MLENRDTTSLAEPDVPELAHDQGDVPGSICLRKIPCVTATLWAQQGNKNRVQELASTTQDVHHRQ